jgi:hypothetical protein
MKDNIVALEKECLVENGSLAYLIRRRVKNMFVGTWCESYIFIHLPSPFASAGMKFT